MTEFTYHVKPIQIICQDKTQISGTQFSPNIKNPDGIVIISAAIGVGQAFYHEFARFLCEHKFCVITFDYRGTGDSRTSSYNIPLKLEDWAIQDMDAVITHAATLTGSDHIFLAGHSIGGQLFSLAEQSKNLTGVILIAASFPYWKRWPFPRNWMMYFFFHILIRVLSIGRKRFPTRIL
ncbi:MAG: alpha/beta fold hydrolase, partial [Desulfobacula sp.]|nr:alpha/beta fold hydrolase [Desulfobacula sp.]